MLKNQKAQNGFTKKLNLKGKGFPVYKKKKLMFTGFIIITY